MSINPVNKNDGELNVDKNKQSQGQKLGTTIVQRIAIGCNVSILLEDLESKRQP